MIKYLILGAGPAGLAFANRLKQEGGTNFLVLEKESEAGGLCRSLDIDGSPLDIGGGHFLDVRLLEANNFLFGFMPEDEWNKYERDTLISLNNCMISYPIESNIWQMEISDQVEYLKSIAKAGCTLGTEMPENFVEWIYWKLGSKIAEFYMIPYNKKIFGKELNHLGTYWMEKLPSVSFEETLRSCLTKKPFGKQPGHTQFYYPKKFGYGELWKRMANEIHSNIEYNVAVNGIDFRTKEIKTTEGNKYYADCIITTIPWMEFKKIAGMPEEIKLSLSRLKFNSIQIEYFSEKMDTKAYWIYYPDMNLPYHRVLVRHNFCPNSKGYWTETNSERVITENSKCNFRYINQYAYPFNTLEKPKIMKRLLGWSSIQGVYGLGRWGEHQHYNSDVTVDLAINLANRLLNR